MNRLCMSRRALSNGKLLAVLASVAGFMVIFGFFILPPFYDALCAWAGIDRNPNEVAQTVDDIDEERELRTFFKSRVNDGLPVRFFAKEQKQNVHIGQSYTNYYILENLSQEPQYLRPIHSVNPPFAAKSFAMTVCFCFNDMEIGPGEKREFRVEYQFNPDIDPSVSTAWVQYNIHRISADEMRVGNTLNGSKDAATQ